MATYSEITITFNQDFASGDSVKFKVTDTVTTLAFTVIEKWEALRSAASQVTVGLPTATAGERSSDLLISHKLLILITIAQMCMKSRKPPM